MAVYQSNLTSLTPSPQSMLAMTLMMWIVTTNSTCSFLQCWNIFTYTARDSRSCHHECHHCFSSTKNTRNCLRCWMAYRLRLPHWSTQYKHIRTIRMKKQWWICLDDHVSTQLLYQGPNQNVLKVSNTFYNSSNIWDVTYASHTHEKCFSKHTSAFGLDGKLSNCPDKGHRDACSSSVIDMSSSENITPHVAHTCVWFHLAMQCIIELQHATFCRTEMPQGLFFSKKIKNQCVNLHQDDDIPSVKMFLYLDQDIHRHVLQTLRSLQLHRSIP